MTALSTYNKFPSAKGNYSVLVQEATSGVPVFVWDKGVAVESAAIQQLVNLSQHPFVFHHVAAMPDTHMGVGSTIGSVFATDGAVIPAAVGVDIGCGMIAAQSNFTVNSMHMEAESPGFLEQIRFQIEKRIPMGRTNDGGLGDRGAWFNIPDEVKSVWESTLENGFEGIAYKHPELRKANTDRHLGTLGTGNHFIELQHDEADNVWIMLHSGSRGVGNKIGSYFIKKAKELMTRYRIPLPDKDLAYIPQGEELYDDYIQALRWAQDFALANRQLMLQKTVEAVAHVIPGFKTVDEINTHHNYANIEKHYGKSVVLTRKGAIDASAGKLGIIPGSMGTKSYIVEGLGNPNSFHSCSHGAGRAMSRTEAKRRFTIDDHIKATEGVVCRKDADVIDETPGAYKDIDAVIEAERDLVTPIHTLKQLISCKG